MNRDDFTGEETPLVAGVVRGFRCFRALPTGELTGMSFPQQWTTGENRAACHMGPKWMTDGHSDRVGSADCSCGFYAYHSGANRYVSSIFALQGIVEGYGRVTVGPKGFRASKARIVALVNPYGTARSGRPQGFDEWVGFLPAAAVAVIGSIIAVATRDAMVGAVVAISTVGLAWFGWRALRFFRQPATFELPRETWDAVKRRFPEIPVYDTLEEAVAAHPVARSEVES